MNNKYDITLSEQEKETLLKNVKQIEEYLKGLVKGFDTLITLSAKWTYYDDVWGMKKLYIEVKKDFRYKGVWGNSEKEWYEKVSGGVGGLTINFDNITNYELENYCLSLIDNWESIKTIMLNQLEQAKATKQTINNFKI